MSEDNPRARLEARIRAIQPELDIHSLAVNQEGLANEVVVVNGDLVFRFARDSDWARRALRSEIAILERVRPRLSLRVPEPFYATDDAVAYRYLPGETLSRDLLYTLDDAARRAVAAQLGECLRLLHTTPLAGVPATSAPATHAAWLEIRRRAEEKVYPLMLRYQREWAARLFDGMLDDPARFEYAPRLIHGDLGPYHVLFDGQSRRITGLIDFGVAGAGDPALDVGLLLQVYGEAFVSLIVEAYPEAGHWLGRAQFYAQAIELQWALNGLESGDPQWFVAHLGGARR